MGNKPTIAIDWDDVIVDTIPYLLSEYNRVTNEDVKIEQIKTWDLSKVCNMSIVQFIFHDPDFWRNIPEKKNAFQTVQRLINNGQYDIYICTACQTKQEFDIKYEVLQKHIPGFNMRKIVSLVDKYLFRADLIVDDGLHNLDACKPFVKHCVVMDMPHNKNADPEYMRIHELGELPDILEKVFGFSN